MILSPADLPRDLSYDLGAIGGVPAGRRDEYLRGLCLDAWNGLYGDPGRALLAHLHRKHCSPGRRLLVRLREVRGSPREAVVEEVLRGEARVALEELVETARAWADLSGPTVRYPSGSGEAPG